MDNQSRSTPSRLGGELPVSMQEARAMALSRQCHVRSCGGRADTTSREFHAIIAFSLPALLKRGRQLLHSAIWMIFTGVVRGYCDVNNCKIRMPSVEAWW
jgi:hypothetical protein